MLICKRVSIVVLLPLLMLSCVSVQAGAKAAKPSVLLVPNRYAIVQFAFTVAQMRKMPLFTYEERVGVDSLIMYAWDVDQHEWQKTDLSEYRSGSLVTTPVDNVILLGEEGGLPEELSQSPMWCANVEQIETLDIVKIINSLNDVLKFKKHEWRWFAKKYGLTLKDLNKDRRRYGRYGKPGKMQTIPEPPSENADDLPPAEISKTLSVDVFEKGVPAEKPVLVEPLKESAEPLKDDLPENK